ncbi:MAG TPA: SBBP repeat-containing protein, partial [Planctomycetota bacterium]|nr:SBBP repeat-containing protein [Planctomycetota bacterium]
ELGAGYRPEHELVIDPSLAYSTFLGGTSLESAAAVRVDATGAAYLAGVTQSFDLPTTVGAFDRTLTGTTNFPDVFVAKLNATGSALLYSTFLGGGATDVGRALAIDAAGNAYVTGQTTSSDFPTTGGAFIASIPQPPPLGSPNDAFVTKLNATGSALVYSTFLGGAQDIDDGLGIAVDGAGNAYVTGETGSTDFPTTVGAFDTTSNGAFDAFLAKLNPAGTALVYSTFLGGAQVEFGQRVTVGATGEATVMGSTSSPNFPTSAGAFDTTANGGFDVFVARLNPAGSALLYSTFLGGLDSEGSGGLAIDSAGDAYVSGGTSSLDFPTTVGAFDTTPAGGDAFVTKLNATGSALVYSTFLGGAQDIDDGLGI